MKRFLSVFISISIAVSAYFAVPVLGAHAISVPEVGHSAASALPSFEMGSLRDLSTPVETAENVEIAREYSAGFPPSYDPRDDDTVITAKDQGQYATCWAFGALSVAESFQRVLNGRIFDFSAKHLATYQSSLNPVLNHLDARNSWTAGGTAEMAASYLSNFNGPAFESDFPYAGAPGWDSEYVNTLKMGRMHITDFNFVSGEEKIKDYILKYGGVTACMWAGGGTSTSQGNFSTYYESTTCGFYYDGGFPANHLVEIIGWDDSFSVSSFKAGRRPSTPGAWLVKNSWGSFYDFFWLSYQDSGLWWTDNDINPNIVTLGFGSVTKARYAIHNEFVKSRYGYASAFIRGTGMMPMVSVFPMEQGSVVTDVSVEFFTYGENFEGRVYIIPNPGNLNKHNYVNTFNTAVPQGIADIKSGVSTIKLNTPYAINANGSYAFMVIVRDKNNASAPMCIPVEYQTGSTKGISYAGESKYGLMDLYDIIRAQATVPVKVIYKASDYIPVNSALNGAPEFSGGQVSQSIIYNGNSIVNVKLEGETLLFEGQDYEINGSGIIFSEPFVAAHSERFNAVIAFSEGIKRTVQYFTVAPVKYDVNNDGYVNVADVHCLMRFIVDDFGYDGDMNGDEITNIEDALYLLKIVVGIIVV